jgi:hypothetical protein
MSDKTVTCKVISDTPVDRVYKGDTLSLPEAIANQFVEKGLVEIIEEVAPEEAIAESAPEATSLDVLAPEEPTSEVAAPWS